MPKTKLESAVRNASKVKRDRVMFPLRKSHTVKVLPLYPACCNAPNAFNAHIAYKSAAASATTTDSAIAVMVNINFLLRLFFTLPCGNALLRLRQPKNSRAIALNVSGISQKQ